MGIYYKSLGEIPLIVENDTLLPHYFNKFILIIRRGPSCQQFYK